MNNLTYEAATAYLESFINYEKKPSDSFNSRQFNLERIRLLLSDLGNPHDKLKVIHIAGSKGKGSTAAMITSVLSAVGYKTGLYSSPHLVTPRERFRIDGRLISEEQLAALVSQLQPHIVKVSKQSEHLGPLSFFEIYTALGFLFFVAEGVDFVALEVGLGGRLDATNIVTPLISVITQISFDHVSILGDTLASIAYEKAGIIKRNGLIVSSPQPLEAQEVIAKVCVAKKARLFQVGQDITFERLDFDQAGQHFNLKSELAEYNRCYLPLLGAYQIINAATAVKALELLRFHGYEISPEQMKTGLSQTSWEGRMQIVGHNPTILIDVAHSPASARVLRKAITETFSYDKLIFVVGIHADKDIKNIGAQLCQIADVAILTRGNIPRAAEPGHIKGEWEEFGIELVVKDEVKSALDYALNIAGKNDLICLTGSFVPLGEAMELLAHSPE